MRWKCNKLLRMKCEEAGCFEDEVWMGARRPRNKYWFGANLGYQQFEDREGPINNKDNFDITKFAFLVVPRKERVGALIER